MKGRNIVHRYRALDNFSTEEYVTSSVLGQGVFDSPSLTLVIGANIFLKILNTFKVIRHILRHLESYTCIISWINWIKRTKKNNFFNFFG
jgi:hypothetical protein